MWRFKNPDSKIVLKQGGGEITPSTLTDEIVERLIKENPNYESQFEKVEEEVKKEKKETVK